MCIRDSSVGAGVVTARAFGRGDREAVGQALSHALVLGGGIGLSCGLVCLVLARPILRLSGAEGDVIACALPYFLVVAVPSVVLCLQLILSSGLRAMKDTKSPMYVTVLCNLLNILLNVLLIKLGLGILGLGLATTLSRLAGSAALFLLLRKKLSRGLSLSGLNRQGFAPILRVGLPAGGEKLIMRVGQLVYSSMTVSYTHLDVYKRQFLRRRGCGRHRQRPPYPALRCAPGSGPRPSSPSFGDRRRAARHPPAGRSPER